jgi:LysM repeat protein
MPVAAEENKMINKLGLLILTVVMALVLASCQRSASTPPAGTPAASGEGTLVEPLSPNATQDPMVVLQQYATQTALATMGGTAASGTQVAVITPMISSTPDPNNPVLPSPTPQGGTVQVQQTPQTPVSNVVVPTSTPGKPATYVLQAGEFPYCLARRFNVNPDDLISINNLSNGQLYNAGMQLTIPQTGGGFPGTRALVPHPANYSVRAGDTIYSIACQYGDADPNQIIVANSLTSPYTLSVGKALYIP